MLKIEQIVFYHTQVLCVPFAWTNEHVGDFDATSDIWVGSIPSDLIAVWIDYVVAQVNTINIFEISLHNLQDYSTMQKRPISITIYLSKSIQFSFRH